MDYSKEPFSLFFSGVESDTYFEIATGETNTVLMSYLYIKRKGRKFLRDRIEKKPDLRLLVDSGAHTFLSDKSKEDYSNKPIEYWEKYLEEYVRFARENKDNVFAVVELDIDSLVGTDKVNEWRKKYFEPLEEEGIQVCYVWHRIKGMDEWTRMCQKYSYVGFSFMEDGVGELAQKLYHTAKKYGARIHGFAVTGFDTMLQIPYYTVDSTTWLVGTQFGEVNYFDGRKMTRLNKDKWKRQYKNKLIQMGANWALAEREDPYELIRMNVLTFVKVEEYVRKVMRNKMYWTEGKKQVVEEMRESKLPRGTIPEYEWFDGEMEDWEEYALALGINPSYGKDESVNTILHFFNFLLPDKSALEQYTREQLYALCDTFKLEGVNTQAKALVALTDAFKQHANGERSEFGKPPSNEGAQRAKEREEHEYLVDETEEIIDIPKERCDSLLQQFLPEAGMPEVEAYDEELLKMDIVPVRDEKGRFLKGQKKVRKKKSLYSDVMPKLACDTCFKGSDCPEYKEGYVCAYNKEFGKFNTRNMEDVADAMHGIVEMNMSRLQRMMMFEMMDGGMIDPNVSALMEMNMKYLKQLNDLQSAKVIAQRQTIMTSDGRVEEVTTVTSNPQAGGILAQMFGGMGKASSNKEDKDEDDTIDVEVKK